MRGPREYRPRCFLQLQILFEPQSGCIVHWYQSHRLWLHAAFWDMILVAPISRHGDGKTVRQAASGSATDLAFRSPSQARYNFILGHPYVGRICRVWLRRAGRERFQAFSTFFDSGQELVDQPMPHAANSCGVGCLTNT